MQSSPVIHSTFETEAARIEQTSHEILVNLAGNEHSVTQDLAVEGMHTNTQITIIHVSAHLCGRYICCNVFMHQQADK